MQLSTRQIQTLVQVEAGGKFGIFDESLLGDVRLGPDDFGYVFRVLVVTEKEWIESWLWVGFF
jgi:hypothetical protein